MREIKFRQAITDTDGTFRWHYWGYLFIDTAGLSVFIGPLGPVEWDKRPSYQFTGLKDKKGKEIYEGDTLRNPKDPRGNGLFDVAWSEMFHGWIGNSQTECLQMKACMFDESEIIGNIHQPEE